MKVSEYFGENVFSRAVMQERLPKKVYAEVMSVVEHGGQISMGSADVVAKAMMEWAIEKGATHYTHWFQPLTGVTAEKHDSFLSAPDENGKEILNLTGKQLIMGEPDASSFPSGGLRSTHYARGYTAWDMTSPAFVKEMACGTILCIPTVFVAYSGEALDNKTPLLRSMQALSQQAVRILHLFGNTQAERVIPSVGAEQEYFIVDREKYLKRRDLIYTGRTLFGAPAPKGQELDDQYFGVIRERVGAFMKDLNKELWKMGITATTQHNEVAPAQHECAPIYCTCNVAVDQNQLMMETMKRVATQHGLVCLLHEKPFAGVNGSGKHNNWSMATDTGVNLLSPGETPYENAQFLLFLCAVIKAVDDYQDLLRLSVATAGNDHRLGANEAPPAVVSIFLGDELMGILDAIENDAPYSGTKKTTMKLGVDVLPRFPRDTTDRNRTSPFAFTGNKFEFRMLGSSNSIACANIMLNAAVAESLKIYADRLEGAEDFETALHDMIKKTIKDHKRIIFNGNGYDATWIKEATEVRGLCNYPTTPDCMPHLLDKKNVDMLTAHKIYSVSEMQARCDIMLENYCKAVIIEANTMVDMARKQILPAVEGYASELAASLAAKKAVAPNLACAYETGLVTKLSGLTDQIAEKTDELESAVLELKNAENVKEESFAIRDTILGKMAALRAVADEAETQTSSDYWPFPTYGELLFGVK